MRMLELIRVAGSAEMLRLRLLMRRQLSRVAQAVIAVIIALFTFGLIELAAVVALEPLFGLLGALLVVAAINLLVIGVLLWLASRGAPGRPEEQALEVRQEALASLRRAGVLMTALQWGWRMTRNKRR
jgi:hypothetical protein